MKNKSGNCIYAVINKSSVSSGPTVRISNMKKALEKLKPTYSIAGNFRKKIVETISSPHFKVTYIESSNNRLALVDYICILILRIKSEKVVSFIRDIYFEVFPENFKGIKGQLRKYLNRISNSYYYYMSDPLAFPTLEMAAVFYEKNNLKNEKTYIALPPGTIDDEMFFETEQLAEKRLKKIKFIYVGGIEYKHAGIKNYIDFAASYQEPADFYLVTYDNSIYNILSQYPEDIRKKMQLFKLHKEGIRKLIKAENITFAYHSRPRNEYDDLTYPIKIFDYISYLLPIITEKHKPMMHLLGESYPLYCDVTNPNEVANVCQEVFNGKEYKEILDSLITIRKNNLYEKRAEQIVNLSDL